MEKVGLAGGLLGERELAEGWRPEVGSGSLWPWGVSELPGARFPRQEAVSIICEVTQ